jgi:hypothetical protein
MINFVYLTMRREYRAEIREQRERTRGILGLHVAAPDGRIAVLILSVCRASVPTKNMYIPWRKNNREERTGVQVQHCACSRRIDALHERVSP